MRHLLKQRNLAVLAAFFCVLAGAFDWTGAEPGERMFRSRARTTRCGHGIGQRHVVLDSIHDDFHALLSAASDADGAGDDLHPGPLLAAVPFLDALVDAGAVSGSSPAQFRSVLSDPGPGRGPPAFLA